MAIVRKKRLCYLFLFVCFVFIIFTWFKSFIDISKNGNEREFLRSGISDVEHDEELNENVQSNVNELNNGNETKGSVKYNVHIFYYPWYGNPASDGGSYYHWNHEYLPHWNKDKAAEWPRGKHVPPGDIGSNFYPKLGCYSSRDESVINQHMAWIRSTNVGTVVVSWYPPGQADSQGRSWEQLTPILLDTAEKYQLKIAFHIEPYANRTVDTLKDNMEYIINKYGNHPAFYYYTYKNQKRPLVYIYDSYLISSDEWRRILRTGKSDSVRGTKLDAFYLGLVVKNEDKNILLSSGFDGFYTYFAANDFSYGSTWKNWQTLTGFGRKSKTISSISVGPGYVDDRVRPWNSANSRPRNDGDYYKRAWENALNSNPNIISITSFNEWHEGTQIEPSIPKKISDFKYLDYTPYDPEYYLSLTNEFVKSFS